MGFPDVVEQHPHALAATAGNGSSLTFEALDEASRRLASLLEAKGLTRGDTVAILLPNGLEYLLVAWGAQRAGLFFVPVNWHLSADEATYIVSDCGARALVTTAELAELASLIADSNDTLTVTLMVNGPAGRFEDLYGSLSEASPSRPTPEPNGYYMFYSSGTTGRPKGIRPQIPDTDFGSPLTLEGMLAQLYDFGPETRYLSTGPLYHAAPLGWSLATQALGGQTVIMDRFEPEECLSLIEKHRITHAQFVPTMFVRLLKLPDEVRASYDLSSLQAVVHAAAPCPRDVKEAMIDWLGPIIHEYYAGSESVCFFAVDSHEWLARPGTVGRSMIGTAHILDDDGSELPSGHIGQIWYDSPLTFAYHNDPAKTADAFNSRGWSTLGDLGHLDEDGYLFLSDRRTDLIISGGVNVYPREIEDALALHPDVEDVAVVGMPHAEMGQEVVAVVVPRSFEQAANLETELAKHLDERLAQFKRPRRWVLVEGLPRLPSGKILRRVVRDELMEASGR